MEHFQWRQNLCLSTELLFKQTLTRLVLYFCGYAAFRKSEFVHCRSVTWRSPNISRRRSAKVCCCCIPFHILIPHYLSCWLFKQALSRTLKLAQMVCGFVVHQIICLLWKVHNASQSTGWKGNFCDQKCGVGECTTKREQMPYWLRCAAGDHNMFLFC